MQEKVEIITNHIVHFWTILDKNTQKRILWPGHKKDAAKTTYETSAKKSLNKKKPEIRWNYNGLNCSVGSEQSVLLYGF